MRSSPDIRKRTGCPVTYVYDRRSLSHLVEEHGFTVTGSFVDHIYRYRKEWYWAWMPKPLFHAIELLFGWHLCPTAVAR
jgi:hypothetical protein